MDLEKLQKEKSLQIDFDAETLRVSYCPAVLTPKWMRRLTEEDYGQEALAECLAVLLRSWDLREAKALVPITKERFQSLPSSFLHKVLAAILSDMAPPPPSDAVSDFVPPAPRSSPTRNR